MNKTPSTLARIVVTAAGASALLIAGAAQAALQDRDLDGDTVVDAFYDTDLDITWLRNADVNGLMGWWTAVAWADGYSFAGYEDWRLPTSDTCAEYNCTGSEMGHLWYLELGNPAGGPPNNLGSFQNWQYDRYWSGTEYAPIPGYAWGFYTYYGLQFATSKGFAYYAMAVRDGDVAVVPEPATYVLVLAGLTGLALARRRRPR